MPKKKEPTGTTAAQETKTTAQKTTKSTSTKTAQAKTTRADSASAAPKAAKTTKTAAAATATAKAPVQENSVPVQANLIPEAAIADKPVEAPPPVAESAVTNEQPTADEANPVVTVIIARFDVGHGNSLYIRGDGHTLSWESGTLMENVGNDEWQWTTTEAREGMLAFKLLINDEVWSVGDNMNAAFGETCTVYPSF